MISNQLDIDKPNDPSQNILLAFGCSYFVYDNLMHLIIKRTSSLTLYSHHIVCALGNIMAYPHFGATAAFWGIVTGEVSNIFMHTRKILANEDRKYTLAYEISESLYFVIYMIVRSISTPIMIIACFMSANVPWFVPVAGFLLLLQSF